jgi:hypothetical protein
MLPTVRTASALLVLLMSAPLARGDGSEVTARLARPVPAVDPDAIGRLEMERESRSEQEFQVEIDFIDTTAGTYTLWIETSAGSGILADAGAFDAEDEDEAKYERELDDEEGEEEELPLGVGDLRELEDRAVEVRDPAGAAILVGRIPRFGGRGNGVEEERALPLLRPATEPLPSAAGKVEAEIDDEDSELEVETEGFDVRAQSFSVWIADANAVMQSVGILEPRDDDEDEGELDFGDDSGRPLPLGAVDLYELGGRRIEIRDTQGTVVLEGTIPVLGGGAPTLRTNERLAPEGAGVAARARGSAKAGFEARRGSFRMRIDAMARTTETRATLWMRDPATLQMREVARGDWSGKGTKRVRWEWRGERSQPLPLGVTDPSTLFGRELEIRSENGAVILRGRL